MKLSKVLCNYSSSSEDEHEAEIKKNPLDKLLSNNTGPNSKLLHVPKSIQTMYKDADKILNGPPPSSLDVTKHDERVRSIPHTRGNWSTSIYIKVRVIFLNKTFDPLSEITSLFYTIM